MSFQVVAKKIVREIESNLTGRSGMDWDGIDEEIQQEIRDEWERIVVDVLAKSKSVQKMDTEEK